jgi:hypothetical protein
MLGMCRLRTLSEQPKMAARVARKVFATIRYRFSHLDNDLNCKTGGGQLRGARRSRKLLKKCLLIMDSGLLGGPWVPVVVAD